MRNRSVGAKRVGTKTLAALLGAVIVLGLCGSAAGAARVVDSGGSEGGDPGATMEGDLFAPTRCPPVLTEEQQAILDRAWALVAEMERIVDEAEMYSARESWAQVEIELLDYVSTMVTLEAVLDSFVATVTTEPFPFRYFLGPIVEAVAAQAGGIADVWTVLPEANRDPVRRAVLAAAEASDHPGFWRHMVRLVLSQVERDPDEIRENLEEALARTQADLEATLERMARLEGIITNLEEKIDACEDETLRERLEDKKHLAELDLAVCEAKVARDEFAIEIIEERLAELEANED